MEIKETLKKLEEFDDLSSLDYKQILDYITNLQEELEEEKRINQEDLKLIDELQQENEKWWAIIKDYEMDLHDLWNKNNELEEAQKNFEKQFIKEMDYKSRIEKAVEYLKDNAKYQKASINNNKYYSEYLINQVLDILNGRSDE